MKSIQVLLAVVSAYYLGFRPSHYFLRTVLQKYILITRSLVTLVLALLPIAQTLALYCLEHGTVLTRGEAQLMTGVVSCVSWALHLMYTYLLYHRLSLSIRGPRPMLVPWTICLLINIIRVAIRYHLSTHHYVY